MNRIDYSFSVIWFPQKGFTCHFTSLTTGKLRTAIQLALLDKRWSAEREASGFKSWPDQHSGFLNNWGESAAFLVFSDKDDKM